MFKKIKKMALAIALLAMSYPMTASAHSLWINMTKWTPANVEAQKESTRMYVGWGHAYPVDGLTSAKNFTECKVIFPSGTVQNIDFDHEGISTAGIVTPMAGEYVISLVRKPSVYSIYLENGVEKKSYEPKDTISNRIKTMRTQQSTTTHFFVGEKVLTSSIKKAGNTLELVPLESPYKRGVNYVGGILPVQLLLDGKPVPYTEVTATHAGFSSGDTMAQRLLTDKNGIAHLRVTNWGPWLLKAKAERQAMGDMKAIADVEVYYTTLTFEI